MSVGAQGDGLAGAAAQVVESVKGAAAAGVEKAKEAADVAKAHLLPLPAEGEEATPAPVRICSVCMIERGTIRRSPRDANSASCRV